ncbi:hypothetical protein NQZ68_019323 [Dissostichus eleginoides]|nr:hypothetical protein NQZ68_019323 [Dissostichus eleginoides]
MTSAMNLKNCGSVLVTGASRGLGLQIVHSLASGGFSPGKIIATARNPANTQMMYLKIADNNRADTHLCFFNEASIKSPSHRLPHPNIIVGLDALYRPDCYADRCTLCYAHFWWSWSHRQLPGY